MLQNLWHRDLLRLPQVQKSMHGAFMQSSLISVDDDEDKLACQCWWRTLLGRQRHHYHAGWSACSIGLDVSSQSANEQRNQDIEKYSSRSKPEECPVGSSAFRMALASSLAGQDVPTVCVRSKS